MKKIFVFAVLLNILVFGCGKKQSNVKLEEGTAAYQLAKDISTKTPFYDPDKNNIIVSATDFNITTGEVFEQIQASYGNQANQLKNMDSTRIKEIINKIAEDLADKKILLTAAEKTNIVLPQAELDSALNEQYKRAGGEEKFAELLTKNGVKLDFVKEQIRTGLTIQQYLKNALAQDTEVTEDEIKEAYNEDKTATVRHLLLSTQGKSDSAKQEIYKKMEDLLARAKKGENFEQLVKKYSEDPGVKQNAGLYENFPRGQMVKPFEDAAFSVPVGQFSGIIETRYGYHILKVINRKKETRPLDEVRDEIKQRLEQTKQHEAYIALLDKLRSEAGEDLAKY